MKRLRDIKDPRLREWMRQRREYERSKRRHKSHRMSPWRIEIRNYGEPRFWSVRFCRKCRLEEARHAAGHFGWQALKERCKGEAK